MKADGVPADQILTLCDSPFETLEDLVAPDLYLRAVNSELRTSGRPLMVEADLTKHARAARVKAWCKERDFDPPSQRAVAHALLQISADENCDLHSGESQDQLKTLLGSIRALFDVEP